MISGLKFPYLKTRGQRQLLGVAFIALVGLIFASAWLWTAQESWQGVMLKRRISRGRDVSGQTLSRVWREVKWLDQSLLPGEHLHLPVLTGQLLVQESGIPSDQRADALLRTIEAAQNALAREPAHAYSWARLAWFDNLMNGPSPEAVAALRMSIYVGPAKRPLLNWRLKQAAQNRDLWDEEFKTLLRDQIRRSWRTNPSRLARTVLDSGLVALAREALARDPSARNRLEELVARSKENTGTD